MDYMFSMGSFSPEGDFTIPSRMVNRWKRQMQTAYAELSDAEKESDLEIADQYQSVFDLYAQENKVIVMPVDQHHQMIRKAKEEALDPVRADLLTALTIIRSQAIGKDTSTVILCNSLLERLGLTGK